jgi:chromosome segregation ATPase
VHALEKKLDNQVRFWSLIGPLVILLSMAVLLFKSSTYWYLPLSALVAIPICVKWKTKGLAISLTFLFTLSFFTYQDLPIGERFWHMGISVSMAFSLIILTLALDEVQGVFDQVQLESQSRLDNFLRLDEQMKIKELSLTQEKEELQSRLNAVTQELSQTQTKQQAFQKLTQLANEELILLRHQHEQVIQEVFQRKQQIADLNEKLEQLELSLQEFVNGKTDQQLKEFQKAADTYLQEIEQLKALQVFMEAENARKNETHQQDMQQASEQIRQLKVSLTQQSQQFSSRLEETTKQLQLNYREELKIIEQHYQDRLAQLENKQAQALLDVESNLADSQGQKKELNNQIEQLHQSHQISLNQLEHTYQQRVEELQQDLNQTKMEAQQLNHQLEELQDQHAQLLQLDKNNQKQVNELTQHHQTVLKQLDTSYKDNKQLNHQIQEAKTLEEDLKAVKKELETTRYHLEQYKNREAKLPYALGNTRQMEAMYLQLKEQFQKKSATLDATRRELFYVQEQLQLLQKEQAEREQFSISEQECSLQKDLQKLILEMEHSQEEADREIDALYHLIANLFRQVSNP